MAERRPRVGRASIATRPLLADEREPTWLARRRRPRTGDRTRPEWAATFDREIERALDQHDFARLPALIATDAGRLSHPWPDHFLPLLYAAGAADDSDRVSYPVSGWDLGSLSMRSVQFGDGLSSAST